MEKVPIRYVGRYEPYIDRLLGLKWSIGKVHDVPAEKAPYYMWYQDLFQDARKPQEKKKQPFVPEMPPISMLRHDDEAPPINLAYVDERGIRQYAKEYFGVDLPQKASIGELRNLLVSKMREFA
ncbi:MAG: hypothetical protein KatS3mg082_1807 [Nitrospiraceae bacterium]|nr:MAG: hypothetical protein KatS3mg082_1807 [Nitrospiraceae bacterium]